MGLIHDNLDFSLNGKEWYYAFHEDTLPLSDVRNIRIATNDKQEIDLLKFLKFDIFKIF